MDVSPRTRLITAYRREVTLENCGFECIDPECLVRSQWQSRSKNSIYLVYRWCVAVFVVAVVIVSMIYNEDELRRGIFFAYLTRWGILTNMIVGVLGAVLVTIWHFHTDFYRKLLFIVNKMKGETIARVKSIEIFEIFKISEMCKKKKIFFEKMEKSIEISIVLGSLFQSVFTNTVKCRCHSKSIGRCTTLHWSFRL